MPYDNQPAYDRLIFELSSPGRMAYSLPELDVPVEDVRAGLPESALRREAPALPEVSELDHFVAGDGRGSRVRPVGGVGNEDLPPVLALGQVIRADHEHAGELALGAGRGLQRDRIHPRDLGQHAGQLIHQTERPL